MQTATKDLSCCITADKTGAELVEFATAEGLDNLYLYDVTGLADGRCAREVQRALESVAGVKAAEVSLSHGKALVKGADKASVSSDALIAAVTAVGYQLSAA